MDLPAILAAAGVAIFSSTVVAALVSGLVTWSVSRNALDQQRLTENTQLLTVLMAIGHGRDPAGLRSTVGHGEVVGAIHAIATLGRAYKPLKVPALEYLRALSETYEPAGFSPNPVIHAVVEEARDRLIASR